MGSDVRSFTVVTLSLGLTDESPVVEEFSEIMCRSIRFIKRPGTLVVTIWYEVSFYYKIPSRFMCSH